jgi:hypothetical protein
MSEGVEDSEPIQSADLAITLKEPPAGSPNKIGETTAIVRPYLDG